MIIRIMPLWFLLLALYLWHMNDQERLFIVLWVAWPLSLQLAGLRAELVRFHRALDEPFIKLLRRGTDAKH